MKIDDPALEIARLKAAEKEAWPEPPPAVEKLKKWPALPDGGKLKDKLKPWRPEESEYINYGTFTPEGMPLSEVLRYLAILAGMIALALLVN